MFKKQTAKILIIALFLVSFSTFFALPAFAEDLPLEAEYATDAAAAADGYVCRIGDEGTGKYYLKIHDGANGAFGKVANNQTITLIKDITGIGTGLLGVNGGGRTFTFDGNGKKIEGSGTGWIMNLAGNNATSRTSVSIKNLTIINNGAGAGFQTQFSHVSFYNVHVEVKGISPYGVIIMQSDSELNIYENSLIRVTANPDGGDKCVGIRYNAGNVNVNLYGGLIDVTNMGIRGNQAGSFSMYGGMINANKNATHGTGSVWAAHASFTANFYGGEVISRRNAVVIANYGAKINIYGGTFSFGENPYSAYGCAIAGGGTTEHGFINIYGGYFVQDKSSASPVVNLNHADSKINIFGGTFENGARPFNGGGTAGYAVINYPAETKVLNLGPSMKNGAAVRLVTDSSGIRFISDMSKVLIDNANSLKSLNVIKSYSFGTLICDSATLGGTAFTHKALTSGGILYQDIPAVNGIVDNGDGILTTYAALIDLKTQNHTKDYAAVSYIKYIMADDSAVYVYSDFNPEQNVRNIRQVSYRALSDVKTEQVTEDGYVYKYEVTEYLVLEDGVYVTKTENAYSCYSPEQIAILRSYID